MVFVWCIFREIQTVGYLLERRGGVEIKGKGIMDTYFLNGVSDTFDPSRKRSTSVPIKPNLEPERVFVRKELSVAQKPASTSQPSNSSFCSVM